MKALLALLVGAAVLASACNHDGARQAAGAPSPSAVTGKHAASPDARPPADVVPAGDVLARVSGTGSGTFGGFQPHPAAYLYFQCWGNGSVTVRGITGFTTPCDADGEQTVERLERAVRKDSVISIVVSGTGDWAVSVDTSAVEFPA